MVTLVNAAPPTVPATPRYEPRNAAVTDASAVPATWVAETSSFFALGAFSAGTMPVSHWVLFAHLVWSYLLQFVHCVPFIQWVRSAHWVWLSRWTARRSFAGFSFFSADIISFAH